jgi:hypothetical protein
MHTSFDRVATAIFSGLLVAACAPVVSPTPITAPSPSGPSASTSAAPTPSSTPNSSPSAVADARPLGWVPIGEVKTGDGIENFLAFDGGYLGWQATSPDSFPVAWHSSDGLSWTRTDLAKPVTPCPGWTRRPDGEVLADATNGKAVVLVGLEYVPGAATCGTWQAAAWVSRDGTSWKRAPGFGASIDGNAWSEDVWATPDGWEAVVKSPGKITIWQSTDGLTWTSGTVIASGDVGLGAHAVDGAGARLLVVSDFSSETSRLLVSRDGHDWQDADGPPPTDGGISRLLAPNSRFPSWIAVTTDDEAGRSTIWTSTDLTHWARVPFPMPTVESAAHTSYGVLALGGDPCRDMGGTCDSDPPQYFLSTDGANWAPLNAAFVADAFVEGDAGVIGIGQAAKQGDPRVVSRLEPYSEGEATLFTGLRPDARFACAARRADLPARAVAGVECSPQVDGIDRIGAYLFADREDLLDTYFRRLADNGVKPRSGSCPQRAGEVAYVPGDDGATVGPYRYGCYLNEFGVANYRFTDPDYLVYVGILGTSKDLKRLHDWAWRGNQDVPGGPTVWRGNAYEPGVGGESSESILSISPDSTVGYTTTMIDR